jgi:hypothetical protein
MLNIIHRNSLQGLHLLLRTCPSAHWWKLKPLQRTGRIAVEQIHPTFGFIAGTVFSGIERCPLSEQEKILSDAL